ncbi:MAG TPA: glycosyltransferase [Gemmatimonadaceae bacterium]|jgi:glycosyltransferase involved in cell wall biosynthesis|nr:glycosyltransferase [Gemmatimonadaceae bacterium]
MTTISVIIPCYNAAPFLDEAITSVRMQTRPPDEIIVVDDCSTDDSHAIALSHGVMVKRTPVNTGGCGARNLGLSVARGEMVAWLDADDFWEPEHLETVVSLLETHEDAVLAFGLVRETGAGAREWHALLPAGVSVQALDACLRRCVLPHNAVVVRREAVRAIGGYDETMRIAGDYDLWLRLSRRHRFVCTHRITGNWRVHPNQLSAGGDLTRYWTMEYQSRERFLSVCRVEESASVAEHVEETMRRVWEEHLLNAWWARNGRQMRFHLAMRQYVPGSDALHRRWLLRTLLLPAMRAFDQLPTGVRRVVRATAARRSPRSNDSMTA